MTGRPDPTHSESAVCEHADVRYFKDEGGAVACMVCGRLFGHLEGEWFVAFNPSRPVSAPECRLKPAQKRVVQWLIDGGHPATVQSICAYYDRRGRAVFDAERQGRIGAATRVLNGLERVGAAEDGHLTREGRRAARDA